MVAFQFFTYARPGEVKRSVRRQLIPPARSRGPLSKWCFSIAPQEDDPNVRQAVTKTGTMDDTIIFDQPPWFSDLIVKNFEMLPAEAPLFPFSAAEAAFHFKLAAGAMGLPELCMYQLRHGGASEDLLGQVRDIAAIKARGRWRTESSLRRYAKPAQIQRLLNKLDKRRRDFAEHSWNHLPDLLNLRRPAALP